MYSNAEKLEALRYTLGLTQGQMAKKIGVSKEALARFEQDDKSLNNKKTSAQYKIRAFLEVQDISPELIAESKLVLELNERQKSIPKHFVEGKCYKIYDKGSNYKKTSLSGTTWDCDCIFMFLRKDGIHHVFRDVKGGWTRTFTDAQLCGKKIQEVEL